MYITINGSYLRYVFNPETDPYNPENSSLLSDTLFLKNHLEEGILHATVVRGEGLTEFFDSNTNYTWEKIN